MRTYVSHHYGIQDFIDSIKGAPRHSRASRPDDFVDYMTLEKTVECALYGHQATTDLVEKTVSELNADQYLTDSATLWENAMVGPITNVPAFLAGNPECMMRQSRNFNSLGPITLIYNASTSGGISNATTQKIGAMVYALIQTVQRVRPVELKVVGSLKPIKGYNKENYVPVVHLDASTPMQQIAFAIAHTAFARHLQFSGGYKLVGGLTECIHWAWEKMPEDQAPMMLGSVNAPMTGFHEIEPVYEKPEDTIFIQGQYLDDKDLKRPHDWIKARVQELTAL